MFCPNETEPHHILDSRNSDKLIPNGSREGGFSSQAPEHQIHRITVTLAVGHKAVTAVEVLDFQSCRQKNFQTSFLAFQKAIAKPTRLSLFDRANPNTLGQASRKVIENSVIAFALCFSQIPEFVGFYLNCLGFRL